MYIVYTERHKLHATDHVTLEGAPFVLEEVPARAGLCEIGRRIAGLRLPALIVQEGGYRLESLGESAVVFLGGFALW